MDGKLLEYSIIAVYLFFLVIVGVAFRKFSANASDYFRSGAQGTWWLVGTSLYISAVSSSTFTAHAGLAYDAGLTVIANQMGFWMGVLFNVLFLARWYRQLRCITFPEVLRLRFGGHVEQLYSITSIFFNLVFASITLWAVATFTSAVFELNIFWLILGIGVVILLYSTSGGRWAVMSTDFLQGVILIPMALLVAWLVLGEVGGFSGLLQGIRDAGLSERFALIKDKDNPWFGGDNYTLSWVFANWVYGIIMSCHLGASVRYFSCKDGREAQLAAGWNLVLQVPMMFIFIIPPIAAQLLYPEIINAMEYAKPAETAYAVVASQLLPAGLLGLMVTAMFAASMANIDTGLNSNAAIYVQNMHPGILRLLKREPGSDEQLLRLSKFVSVILGILIILVAFYFASQDALGMFEVMLNFMGMFGIPLVIPVAMAVFIPRGPSWSPFVVIGASALPGFAKLVAASKTAALNKLIEDPALELGGVEAFLTRLIWIPEPWSFQMSIVLVFGIGIVTYLLCLPFDRFESNEYKEKVREFYKRMHTPVDFKREVGVSNDHVQCRMLGNFVLIIGVLILLMLFIPSNGIAGRIQIGFVSAFIVGVGAFLRVAGVFIERRNARIKASQE